MVNATWKYQPAATGLRSASHCARTGIGTLGGSRQNCGDAYRAAVGTSLRHGRRADVRQASIAAMSPTLTVGQGRGLVASAIGGAVLNFRGDAGRQKIRRRASHRGIHPRIRQRNLRGPRSRPRVGATGYGPRLISQNFHPPVITTAVSDSASPAAPCRGTPSRRSRCSPG